MCIKGRVRKYNSIQQPDVRECSVNSLPLFDNIKLSTLETRAYNIY